MNKLFTLVLLYSIAVISMVSCKNADDIRKRAKAQNHYTVKIIEAIKPTNLGVIKKADVAVFTASLKNAILVDVRTPEEFAEGHLKNAVNINFKKRTFPNYINAIDKNKQVAIYCRSGNRSGKAALIMQSLGFKNILDLDGGFKAWNTAKKEVVKMDNKANVILQANLKKGTFKENTAIGKNHQINVNDFDEIIKAGKVTVVDVRTAKEYAAGHIKGAVNINWKNRHFAKNILKVTAEKPIAIYCRSGNRATRAMFVMNALGFKEIYNLKDGIKSWNTANMPIKILEVKGDKHHLDVTNFNNAILGKVGTLIDIRTPSEYKDFHIPGAKMIDFKNDNFKTEFEKLDKKVPVLIYCRSGGRSGRATKVLTNMGFEVYNLNKGINQWKAQGMHVEGNNVKSKHHSEEGC